MNISELRLKVKDVVARLNTREVYIVLLIIVVGFGSFGLGRLSLLESRTAPLHLPHAMPFESPQTASAASSVNSQLSKVSGPHDSDTLPPVAGGKLVASKGGTRYHYPWCSGATRISEANKLWFNSVEEARKAGYTPASNCKGLK